MSTRPPSDSTQLCPRDSQKSGRRESHRWAVIAPPLTLADDTDRGPRTLGCTHFTQTRTLGRYAPIQLGWEGTCIHLGPGNPNVHKEVGYPKVFIRLKVLV